MNNIKFLPPYIDKFTHHTFFHKHVFSTGYLLSKLLVFYYIKNDSLFFIYIYVCLFILLLHIEQNLSVKMFEIDC
jgi:hypothetical protein